MDKECCKEIKCKFFKSVIKGTSKKCFVHGKNNPKLSEKIETIDCDGWEKGKIHSSVDFEIAAWSTPHYD